MNKINPKENFDENNIVEICAKVVDRCSISHGGERIHDGYVPDFLDRLGDGYNDFIQIDIDVKTGKILNWDVKMAEKFLNKISLRTL